MEETSQVIKYLELSDLIEIHRRHLSSEGIETSFAGVLHNPNSLGYLLSSTTVGRLATHGADGYPYITPVNFVYHEGKEIVISLAIWKPLNQWASIRWICKQTSGRTAQVQGPLGVQYV